METTQARTGVDRRTVLRSGAGVVAGSLLAATAATVPAAAEQHEQWPIQRFDRENTGYNPDGTPLRSSPEALIDEDIPTGQVADYLVADGTVYLHTADSGLGAINAGSGELQWSFEGADSPLIPEFVEGDMVLARSLDGNVFVVDRNDGSLTAERSTGQGYGVVPGVTGRWFAPVSEGRVIAVEGASEEAAWETQVEGTGVRPAFADGRVFVSTVELPPEEINFEDPAGIDAGGRLYALDAGDGAVLWERSRVGGSLAPPTVRDGTVYWTGTDGDILTYDAETGDSGWDFKTDGSFNTPPAVTGELLFAGNDDGGLYGLDTSTGEQVGRIPAGDPVYGGPVVVDDVVYAGTTTGTVFAFDFAEGEKLWDFAADTPIRALSVWGGRAVLGTDAGYYVLGEGDGDSGGTTTRTATGGGTDSDGSGSGQTEDATGGADDGTSEQRQRGLFSNQGDEPEFISNPFNLTTLGFVLSVAGIIYQMIQGR